MKFIFGHCGLHSHGLGALGGSGSGTFHLFFFFFLLYYVRNSAMCWVALLCLCSRQSGSPESFGVVKKAFIKKVGHLHQVPNSIYLGYSPSFVVVLSVIKFFKFDVPSILV